jgi:hypothetical protein
MTVLPIMVVSEITTGKITARDQITVSEINSRMLRNPRITTAEDLEITLRIIQIIRITEDSGTIRDQQISKLLRNRTTIGIPTEAVLDKTIINKETSS